MITIIDYKAGNLTSVQRALTHLGIENQISKDPDVVRKAERVIFPGVGAAGSAMETLKERNLDSALKESFQRGTPILGICLGSQIILSESEEDGNTPGLGILPGRCIKFQFTDETFKIPHMGWNAVSITQAHPVLAHLNPGDEFYFVHSYYPQPESAENVFATSEYGFEFPVAVGVDNLFAVQFHTEKSGPLGLQTLKNFVEWIV
ncbi:MAG: imidazole glycerol phosphate synthase subunit HisH [Anaerolineae bacterium]|jgi:imidazole glycerol-phosphate synthase subunit HisH|nr:imidazole glycerol phosphate synthase subunit HisH [Anaerolineae bacterium]MBT7191271.1 imidazole glycerol phosphate synthase subunit HisH [Anaerolineae bacterium]MBT7991408.1 imidazole glycerol phosphate synthase subunit HisH [Anaerolineae bacterium]